MLRDLFLVALCLLIPVDSVSGVFTDYPVEFFPKGGSRVSVADVDNDGDLDLSFANYGDRLDATIFLNDVAGFREAVSITRVPQAGYALMGDVDGDGRVDVVCGAGPFNAALFLNQGVPVLFDQYAWIAPDDDLVPDARTLADVDADGDLDLVCENAGLYRNVGPANGYFGVLEAAGPNNDDLIDLADVNGDGELDMICAAGVFLNIPGVDLFPPSPSWAVPRGRSIGVGDLDLDGALDILALAPDTLGVNASLVTYRNRNLSGVFDMDPVEATVPGGVDFMGVQLGDLELDGDVDVVVMLRAIRGAVVRVYVNEAGHLREDGSLVTSLATSICLFDRDGDGDLDLLVGDLLQSNVMYENLSLRAKPATIAVGGAPPGLTDSAWADFDRDGAMDLLAGLSDRDVILSNDHGTLVSRFEIPRASASIRAVAWLDLDGDGDLDFVDSAAGVTTLFKNQGNLEFIASEQINDALGYCSFGDFDGDSDLDIVTRGRLLRNDNGVIGGIAVWTAPEPDPVSSAWGDFDQDGDADLAYGGPQLRVFVNRASVLDRMPVWHSETRYETRLWFNGLAWGDSDGDGDLDLLCDDGVYVMLYRNDGGSFNQAWLTVKVGGRNHWVDCDNDRDLDVLTGNQLFTNKRGLLSSPVSLGDIPTVFSPADLDGDGDIDFCGLAGGQLLLREATRNDAPAAMPDTPSRVQDVRATRLTGNRLEIRYRLIDAQSDPAFIVPEVSSDNGGAWSTLPVPAQFTEHLETSPSGVEHAFVWDMTDHPIELVGSVLRLEPLSHPHRSGVAQRSSVFHFQLGDISIDRPFLIASLADTLPVTAVGDSVRFGLRLRNQGPAPGRIFAITPSSPDITLSAALRLELEQGLEMNPNETLTRELIFHPSVGGTFAATVEILSDDPRNPVQTVRVDADAQGLGFKLFATPLDHVKDALTVVCTQDHVVDADSVVLCYRDGGAQAFQRRRMDRVSVQGIEQYTLTLVDAGRNRRGVEYFAGAYNGGAFLSSELQRRPSLVTNVRFPQDRAQVAKTYRMISIPFGFASGSFRTVLASLGDSGGGSRWRLFAYEPDRSGAGPYTALNDVAGATFQPGTSYWLITRDNVLPDTGPVEARSAPTGSLFPIPLRDGWNMIGNPFNFAVDWDEVRLDNERLGDKTGSNAPLIELYTGGGYDEVKPNPTFGTRLFRPFTGYWFDNKAGADTLWVPPVEVQPVPATGARQRAASERGWAVTVVATSNEASDAMNRFGESDLALETADARDLRDPPLAPGDALTVYFPHRDWRSAAGFYTHDIRGAATDIRAMGSYLGTDGDVFGHVWRFDLARQCEGSEEISPITLSFQGLDQIPPASRIILIDRELGKVVDLRQRPEYSFFAGARGYAPADDDCRFVAIVGSPDYLATRELPALPTSTRLHPNFPNPFNPMTVIRYEVARATPVSLRVYNALGQRVVTLFEGRRDPGIYETSWNGMNNLDQPVAAGVYIAKMQTSDGEYSTKMVLLK